MGLACVGWSHDVWFQPLFAVRSSNINCLIAYLQLACEGMLLKSRGNGWSGDNSTPRGRCRRPGSSKTETSTAITVGSAHSEGSLASGPWTETKAPAEGVVALRGLIAQ
jgi:hypothetical protein